MCLIVFAYKDHPQYRFVLAGNRDEFYERPSAPADFWEDHPHVLAGRDLKDEGTWLGITLEGRFACITNHRNPKLLKGNTYSRGLLVSDYLIGNKPPMEYLSAVAGANRVYNPFNLIVGDGGTLCYYSNVTGQMFEILPGLYGLSNHFLDTPWPKVLNAKEAMNRLLQEPEFDKYEMLSVLSDKTPAREFELPITGVGEEWERLLSPIFIATSIYGTRSSYVLTIDWEQNVRFVERNHSPEYEEYQDLEYTFTISS